MGWETEAIPILIAGNTVLVNSSGFFMYNGKPAANNLLLAEVPHDFTDPFGNQVFAGLNLLTPFAAGQYRVLTISQQSASIVLRYSTVGQNTWTLGASEVFPSTTTINLNADSLIMAAVTGGLVPVFNLQGILQLQAQSAFNTAFDVLGFAILWANAQGNLVLQNNAGSNAAVSWPGIVPAGQIDISTNAVGNVATAGNITKAWSIPATDGVVGTTYLIDTTVEVVIGATAAETLTLGISINGTQTALATLGAAFNGSALSAAYQAPVKLKLIVDAIAGNTPFVTVEGSLGQTSANRLATNSANLSGQSTSTTFNKANTNTVALYAQWGGAGGTGQNVQTRYSEFTRRSN